MRIPKHCLHRGSGRGVVRLDGHDFYTGLYGTPEAEAKYQQYVARWLAGKAKGESMAPASPAGLEIVELVNRYMSFVDVRYRDRTGAPSKQAGRKKYALAVLAELFGNEAASTFGPRSLEAVRAHMGQLGWSRNFTNHSINAIRQAFQWGVAQELVPGAIWIALRSVKSLGRNDPWEKPTVPRRSVPWHHARLTIYHALPVVRHLLMVQYFTGMRPGEAARIRPMDVSTVGLDPFGYRHDGVWVYAPAEWKGEWRDKERIVMLGPHAQRVLAPYLDRAPDRYCFSPREAVTTYLSSMGRNVRRGRNRQPGEFYHTTAIAKAIRSAAVRANVPHWSPHQLRHLRATEIRSRFGPDAARICLGHSLPGVTGVYAEADLRKAAQVMREIG